MRSEREKLAVEWIRRYLYYIEYMMDNEEQFEWPEWLEAARWLKQSPVKDYRRMETLALETAFDKFEKEFGKSWTTRLVKEQV